MFSRKILCLLASLLIQTNLVKSDCIHGYYYPHSSKCELFYECSYGVLYEFSCPDGLYFNPTENVCDFPVNVDCESVTEDIPETTTEVTTEWTIPTSTTSETTTEVTPEWTTSTSTTPNGAIYRFIFDYHFHNINVEKQFEKIEFSFHYISAR